MRKLTAFLRDCLFWMLAKPAKVDFLVYNMKHLEEHTRHRLHRPIVIACGLIPNILLFVSGVLYAMFAVAFDYMYAIGTHPGKIALGAVYLMATATLNLWAFRKQFSPQQRIITWAACIGSTALVFLSLLQWKASFEIHGHPYIPGAALFLGGVGTISSLTLIYLLIKWPIRFSLQGLITCIFGSCVLLAAVAWFIKSYQLHHYEHHSSAAQHFERLGGTVRWEDWQVVAIQLKARCVVDEDLEPLKQLQAVRSLDVSDTDITDAGMKFIASLKSLHALYMSNLMVSDKGLYRISNLANLRTVDLRGTAVTDRGMTHLGCMTKIRVLNLGRTTVGDEGIKCLAHLHDLEFLYISETNVTRTGIEWLQRKLPNCQVRGIPKDAADWRQGGTDE